ncbi:MAG: hypothetical protein DHS20C05_19540 [Hyphococcus sp.]|nr:MAG: hypothetical protein DHS20C05_19540 [Marinicaulis sp.]
MRRNRLFKGVTFACAPAMAIAIGGSVFAQEYNVACQKPGDARTIEVVAPGEVGRSCDVRYTRQGDNVSIPYHADNSPGFCFDQAKALAVNLVNAGFECGPLEQDTVAAAPATDDIVMTVTKDEPVDSSADLETADTVVDASPLSPTSFGEAGPASTAQAAQAAEATQGADVLEQQMSEILATPPAPSPATNPAANSAASEQTAEPKELETAVEVTPSSFEADDEFETAPPQAANRGPAQLTAALEQPVQTVRAKKPVGRLVGATPDENAAVARANEAPRGVTPVTTASTTASKPTSKPSKISFARTSEDIIRATLQAQAAAWNEGNLDAFMATYWKSDDLKFVADGEISKGWSATMKYYRETYADEKGLGLLGFDRLDVKLVTDTVAVVTGRFNLAKEDQNESGNFTLVMRQDAGRWRIVHDHSVTDAASE